MTLRDTSFFSAMYRKKGMKTLMKYREERESDDEEQDKLEEQHGSGKCLIYE